MCIQQTDLGSEEDVVLDEGDGGEDEPDEDEEEGEQNERETGSDGDEDEQQGGDEGEEDEEEEQDEGGDGEDDSKSFVVSIFAVGDDIKAHYTKPTATFCGATWSKFLGYTGATVEDIWGDVPEAARTLWSVSNQSSYRCDAGWSILEVGYAFRRRPAAVRKLSHRTIAVEFFPIRTFLGYVLRWLCANLAEIYPLTCWSHDI